MAPTAAPRVVDADAKPGGAGPTAQDRAARVLRDAILDGTLQPGARINQEEWATRAGVSLIPTREALHALAGAGLVTYRSRRGYVVTELDLAALEEVYRLRTLLETDALRRGVPHARPADVSALEHEAEACRVAGVAGNVVEQLAANRRFHDALHALAGSAALERLIGVLWDSTEAYRALYYSLQGGSEEADTAHRAIVDAVAARDAALAIRLQDGHRGRAIAALRVALRRD